MTEDIFTANYGQCLMQQERPLVVTREDCYAIIAKARGSDTLTSFKVTPVDSAAGYLGNYHRLHIEISDGKPIHCFIKRMPRGATSKDLVERTGCFLKETFIYQELVPRMSSLGIKFRDCLPTCYLQRPNDLMVFEDVAMQGYRIQSVYQPFDFTALACCVRKVAKFHASTWIFEEEMTKKSGRTYRLNLEYPNYLKEIFFLEEENHPGSTLFRTGIKSMPDVVDLFPELKTERNQQHLKQVLPHLERLFFEVVKVSPRFRNVLSHGDLWTNNIMLRFDGTEAVDCKFVDFQCTRYCPLAQDFLSVLHLTTDRATRTKHAEELGHIYHQELRQVLHSHGYNVDQIYGYEDFLDSVRYMRPQMVMQAIMYKTFMCTPKDISSLLASEQACQCVFYQDRREFLHKMSTKSQKWRSNIKDCVLDLYDLCASFPL